MMICVFRKDTGRIIDLLPHGKIEGDKAIAKDHVRWISKAMDAIEVPEQDTSRFYDEEGNLREICYPKDIQCYTVEEKAALIDRDTGNAIDEAIHPFAGIEEQIGILRVQIAEILVALGLEPTDEFAKLNAIAAEKIQEGQKKKEILNDAKDS